MVYSISMYVCVGGSVGVNEAAASLVDLPRRDESLSMSGRPVCCLCGVMVG